MKAGYDSYNFFGFNRKFKITERKPPPDVVDFFSLCTNGESQMSPNQFRRFLIEFQGESGVTIDDAQRQMEQALHLIRPNFNRCSFTLDEFFTYLFLDDLNGPIISQVHHDMTAPLQHYFIYTGHNSYLTGNQLNSDSSVVPIITALQRGVRVIELDLWPNSAKDGIHVLHGRTLTMPVTLYKCLKSIKEYAFVNSPYPVIITLEDHLTRNLQAKAAGMVTEIFGDMLYCPKAGGSDEFLSPEALKHRVILSTKLPKEYLESKQMGGESSPIVGKDLFEVELFVGEDAPSSFKTGTATDERISSNQDEDDDDDDDDDEDEDEDEDVENEKPDQKAAPVYNQLIGIHSGKAKNGLRKALMVGLGKGKRLSLSEQALERAASLYGTNIIRFTQKNILRVFPKGSRVTSTNFRPLTAWMHGAQMVAFNMQGYGRSLWMMHGMFRSNGGCGYVKKPEFLMSRGPNNEVFDPKTTLLVKKTLRVKVYMGDGWRMDFSRTHFDTFSPPDFYTKLYMVGVPADVTKKKTRVIEDDWMPVWDEEFTFPLRVPELALLKIVVREHDASEKDAFGGQTCLPVSELRSGIRSISLHNKKGEKFASVKLLVRFVFE
ncbi:phosphoinositide phospholipase C 6-like [Cynara cardunculus var. scolymus]|uniref:phosphoinositide phospholipase C 6-like n=1 Tax=Cynara cardunculus var. scolymus TaxID=59895 RepID=UPI000D62BF2E|nr:phosphoinositide phospholipase C 6-like [Cynara cardunculus var. scolymus]